MVTFLFASNSLMQEKLKLRRQQVVAKKQAKLLSGDPLMFDSSDSMSANNSPQSETPPIADQECVQLKRSHSGEEKRQVQIIRLCAIFSNVVGSQRFY